MSRINLGRVVGRSAYEIAVLNGFVGNETAWIASLKGEKGDNGGGAIQGIEILPTDPTGADLWEGRIWIVEGSENNGELNIPPSTPAISLVSNNEQTATIKLITASTDTEDGIITTYEVYKDNTLFETKTNWITSGEIIISGLSPSNSYSLYVKAKDSRGAVSVASNVLTFSTGNESALVFNGTSSYVEVPHSESINLLDDWKISITFEPSDLTSPQKYLLNKNNFYAVTWRYASVSANFYSAVGNFTGPSLASPGAIPIATATKHTVTYEYDATTMTFTTTRNGEVVTNKVDTVPAALKSSSDNLYIGSSGPTANFFLGKIHEVQIFKNNTLSAHWKFTQGSGDTVADLSGNGNTARLHNTSWS